MPCWGMVVMLVCPCNYLTFFIVCLVVAFHTTPLSPWRGVGGEAFSALFKPYILLPSPLGEGSGVRPVEVGGEAGWGGCEAGGDWK